MNLGTIIPIMLFSILFLLFALKKQYVEILITLIVVLILDWAVVKSFSSTPFFGMIAISVAEPLINILIYTIIKLIFMGVYYVLLNKNSIIAIIGYLLISLIINNFYMTISGNIFLDIIFNLIISSILLIVYNKSSYLDDLKWFSIFGLIISFILESLIGSIFFA